MISAVAIAGIRAYQLLLSPWLGRACRFYPSCSEYAVQSFQKHGPWTALRRTLRRLGSCRPLGPGGVDLP